MPDPRSEAERLLSAFLIRREAGEDLDFEELCAAHPQLEPELRRQWGSYQTADGSLFSFFFRHLSKTGRSLGAGRVHPGDEIGDFRLIEKLAEGGQGEVWVAEQHSLRRRVALKLMLPGRISGRARELFMREARAGGRLMHPGIVTVFDQGTEKGHSWIAMELVEGGCTLRDALDAIAEGRLPTDYYRRAAELGAQIAEAMQVAHDANVIHRDIKPRNILITADDRAKITDFGLARISDEEALSQTGDFMGTYAYMSPEQVAARRAGIDHRTDIFSLGVVLYELFSRHQPFSGASTHEIAEKILTAAPPALEKVDPHIPRDLRVVCMKALEKSRQHRFQTMGELAAELRRFLDGQPIITIPPTPLQRSIRWARRHPTARAETLTIIAAALLLYFVVRPQSKPPFTGPDHEQLIVTQSTTYDDSPTFVEDRFLIFERRESEGGQPGLWTVDLHSDLSERPWSPDGEECGAPAVSPNGKWLAFETPASRGKEQTVVVVRRIDPTSLLLAWPTEDLERIEPETGSALGVVWSRDSRFVYTHETDEGRTLMLHDMLDPGVPDRELFHISKRDVSDTGAFQTCFSPDGEQVLIAERSENHTLVLGSAHITIRTEKLDCGLSRSPLWLEDGSILLGRNHSWEASPRLYWLTGSESQRIRDLERHLIGGYTSFAASPDQSMLALAARVETISAYIATPADDAPIQFTPRYPTAHLVWAPDGELVYSGDTGRGTRLNAYDPDTGTDRPLDLELPFLERDDGPYQLDQVVFSQNGERFLFRAKQDPQNGRCDAREWIVIATWPPGEDDVVAVPMDGRHMYFPHVNDAGDRVIWVEMTEGRGRVLGAELDGHRIGPVSEIMDDVRWPARISGDGQWIAASIPRGRIRVTSWEGAEVAILDDADINERPLWLPERSGGANRLAYIHWSRRNPERIDVRAIAMDDTALELELSTLPALDKSSYSVHYDPVSGRGAYYYDHREGGNIWLIRPSIRKGQP